MPDSVYKIITLIGTSTESWEKAAAAAVEHRADRAGFATYGHDRRGLGVVGPGVETPVAPGPHLARHRRDRGGAA